MKHNVFISYRNTDGKHFAKNIYEHLKKHGCKPFYSEREFHGGDEFPGELENKIKDCDVFVLALTPGVYAGFTDETRKIDYVLQEIRTALKYNKRIIPFKDGESIPFSADLFPLELNNVLTIDGYTRSIADQHVLVYHNDLEDPYMQLVRDVKSSIPNRHIKQRFLKFSITCLFLLTAIVLTWHLWPRQPSTNSDNTPPQLELSSIDGLVDGKVQPGQTVSFSISFSDDVNIDSISLSADSIILPKNLAADIQISGNGNTRTVTLSNIQGPEGSYDITIAANAAQDAAGNQSRETHASFVLDATIPTLNMSKPVVAEDSVTVKIYADDETGLSSFYIRPTDITTIGFSASTVTINGTGAVREIIFMGISATSDEECRIDIAAGIAIDENGNKSKAITSHVFSWEASAPNEGTE